MSFIATLSLRQRLASIAIVAFLGFAVSTAFVVNDVRETAMESHRTRIRDIVQVAVGVAAHFKKLEETGALSREQAQQQAKSALRAVRYGSDDYLYAFDFEGRRVMHGGDPKTEGQQMLGKADANGYKFYDVMIDLGRNRGIL